MKTLFQWLIWVIMLIPVIYLVIIWNKIPETVPIHFDIKGNVDRYGSRDDFRTLIIALLIINAGVYLIISNIYRIDPKKNAAQNKDRMQRIAFYVCAYLSAIWVMIIYASVHSDPSMIMKFVFIAMGLLFALLGSNMYNIKPNYFAGIRLPWTLENEDNWRKTHQFAGRLWFFGGLVIAVLALLLKNEWSIYTSGVFIAVLVIIPIIYSYNLYREQTKKI